jgi:hypothetical protein
MNTKNFQKLIKKITQKYDSIHGRLKTRNQSLCQKIFARLKLDEIFYKD